MGKFNINAELEDEVIYENNENKVEINCNAKLTLKKHSKRNLKAKAIQFYLHDDIVREIDLTCKQTGLKRSELVTELLKFALSNLQIVD